MLPEGSLSGQLTLYRATDFPLAWQPERVLLERPLIDASMVKWEGRWYLLGSDHSARSAVKHGELAGRRASQVPGAHSVMYPA